MSAAYVPTVDEILVIADDVNKQNHREAVQCRWLAFASLLAAVLAGGAMVSTGVFLVGVLMAPFIVMFFFLTMVGVSV